MDWYPGKLLKQFFAQKPRVLTPEKRKKLSKVWDELGDVISSLEGISTVLEYELGLDPLAEDVQKVIRELEDIQNWVLDLLLARR